MSGCILHGDALEMLKTLETASVDSIVTDPPSGISFMQEEWDTDKGGRDLWVAWLADIFTEARRVLKPGGHAFVWALPRTSHWTAYALENAGFDIRDSVHHVFGTGMPKSHDVSKAIDRAKGAQRKVVGVAADFALDGYTRKTDGTHAKPTQQVPHGDRWSQPVSISATSEAAQWDGWGTGLKPAHETWWLARSPLSEPTVAANVLRWGTGALNIDASRILASDGYGPVETHGASKFMDDRPWSENGKYKERSKFISGSEKGRWPANFLLSHSLFCQLEGTRRVSAHQHSGKPGHGQKGMFGLEMTGESRCYADSEGMEIVEEWNCAPDCPVRLLNEQGGLRKSGTKKAGHRDSRGGMFHMPSGHTHEAEEGYASRYFASFSYCAKPSRRERNAGDVENTHPTVKAIELMRYLVRMITPPGGVVLDMFGGSGSTALACIEEGFDYLLIERDERYLPIIQARAAYAEKKRGTA